MPLATQDDFWTADLNLTTDKELSGVWLRIIFDSTPIDVTSNFGETVQREATEYLIRRREKGLKIGDFEKVDLTVKLNSNLPIPRLIGIRLNARVICPENGIVLKPEEVIDNPKTPKSQP